MHLYFMIYKVPVRLLLCNFLYKPRTGPCPNGVIAHRAVWLGASPFTVITLFLWLCTTDNLLYLFMSLSVLNPPCLFLFWFQLSHRFEASTSCCGWRLLVQPRGKASEEGEEPDQHPWQFEVVGGLSLAHPCLWASWQKVSNEAVSSAVDHFSPAWGAPWGRREDICVNT